MIMVSLLLVIGIISFIVTIILLPIIISFNRERGIVGRDINKMYKDEIPEMGGIAVVLGTFAGISLLFILSYYMELIEIEDPAFLVTGLIAMAGIAIVGAVDDRYGMRQRMKAILPFLIAIPFGLAADFTTIRIPFIGPVDFGPLMVLIIPVGITAAANSANMLEGFNGLGCGLGIIMSTTLIIVAITSGAVVSLIILIPLLSSLIAFYFFNRYPAKIFPGDTLLLFMGATLAIAAIFGGMKEVGAILFIPMIVEFILKLRRSFTTESFGKLDRFGYLRYYGSVTSLTHVVLKLRRFKEWQVSTVFWGIEFVIAFTILGVLIVIW